MAPVAFTKNKEAGYLRRRELERVVGGKVRGV